jgi:endonuclease/exonuclease/phosphatase family metal-dependent hydrolase
MRISTRILAAVLSFLPALGLSQTVRVASWNLGWHVSAAEVPNWIDKCSRNFKKNPTSKRWDLASGDTAGTTVGWFIKESRANLEGVDLAKMPPCGVYQDGGFNGIAVTPGSYANRVRQLTSFMQSEVRPDVIAFQEVSGAAAVREALGATADQYNICSFDGQFKVQRLAFAWRKQFGEAMEACKVVTPVSLPQETAENQVRPALTVGLRLGGKLVRFMTVHLKSSCVSSLEKGKLDDSNQEACALLQKQIRPLEAGVESLSGGAEHFVVLGDFNRNLWHELHEVAGSEAVRSDGERQLTKPMAAGVLSKSLFKEVFDGEPGGPVTLVPLTCTQDAAKQALCEAAKTRVLSKDENKLLSGFAALGCRNPIGLDHFVVSSSLSSKVKSAEKLSIGRMGGSKGPIEGKPEPLLAVSDHCPIVMTLDF